MSEYFTLQRGVRQEDLLSLYLFVVAISCNSSSKKSSYERYYDWRHKETKLLHYAGDMTAVMSDINFDSEKDQQKIVWNNKDICINKVSVFYKKLFESSVIYVSDLLFQLNNIDSFKIISKKISRTSFVIWTGLRHSVPQ